MTEQILIESYIPITPDNVKTITFEDKINVNNIPEELKILKRWCVWKPIWDDPEADIKKVKKHPYDRSGNLCKWKDLRNLMSFDQAVDKLKIHSEFGGLQFALSAMDELVTVDYDAIFGDTPNPICDSMFITETEKGQTKTLLPECYVEELAKLGNPYTEVSPSGKGLRVVAYGSLPRAQYHASYCPEIYAADKLVTITGHHINGTAKNLIPAQNLEDFVQKHYPDKLSGEDVYDKLLDKAKPLTDEEVVLKAKTSKKLGDEFFKAYELGEDIKGDKSETDYFSVSRLSWYSPNIAQLYRLMQASGLHRDKWKDPYTPSSKFWKEKIEAASVPCDYLTRTIVAVLSNQTDVWDPNYTTNTVDEDVLYEDYAFKVTIDGIFKNTNLGTKAEPKYEFCFWCPTPAYIGSVGYNTKTSQMFVQLVYKTQDIWKRVWVTPDQLTIKNNLEKWGNKLVMTSEDAKELAVMFKNMTTKKQKEPHEEVYSAVGYYADNSCFILGNRKITANAITEITPLEMPFVDKLVKKGTLEGYVEAGKVLMQFDVLRAKFYCTMASLLLPLVYRKNVTVTHAVASGNLKGQSSYWNMGAFGHPITLQINPSSSEKGIQGALALAQGLPTSIEELTGKASLLKDLQYKSTTGVSRTLLSRSSQVVGGNEQVSLIIANSENPLFTEKDRLGNLVRNLTLDDTIPILPNDIISKMEDQIQTNYGHVGELLLQIILQEKPRLFSLLQEFEQKLPDMGESIPKNRFKNMVAFFCLSGYLCEKLFTKIGIDNKDPVPILEHILLKNLGSVAGKPLHERVLPIIGEFFVSHKSDFVSVLPGEKELSNRKGFIEKNSIAFLPGVLEKYLEQEFGEGQGKAIMKELLLQDCLSPRDEIHPKNKHVENHVSFEVYKIKNSAFKAFGNLDLDAIDENNEDEPKPTEPEPRAQKEQPPELQNSVTEILNTENTENPAIVNTVNVEDFFSEA